MLGLGALIAATAFFGAAAYISFAEHPARLCLDDRAALLQWAPAYRRGFIMQSSLAVISAVLGFAEFWFSRQSASAIGAALILANWPYTLTIIMPVNRQLERKDLAGTDVRRLLVRWGQLHAIRTFLGAAAVVALVAQRF